MINHTADCFWNCAVLGCGADLAPWLRDRGSLTLRIQQRWMADMHDYLHV